MLHALPHVSLALLGTIALLAPMETSYRTAHVCPARTVWTAHSLVANNVWQDIIPIVGFAQNVQISVQNVKRTNPSVSFASRAVTSREEYASRAGKWKDVWIAIRLAAFYAHKDILYRRGLSRHVWHAQLAASHALRLHNAIVVEMDSSLMGVVAVSVAPLAVWRASTQLPVLSAKQGMFWSMKNA